MKYKTTKKDIMQGYYNVIECSYCGMQTLLSNHAPEAYTAGVYGWNADIYNLGDRVIVCTGYRPFGNYKSREAYEIIRKYETLALNANNDKTLIESLLTDCVNEILKTKKN